jgi:hypothetical protein
MRRARGPAHVALADVTDIVGGIVGTLAIEPLPD